MAKLTDKEIADRKKAFASIAKSIKKKQAGKDATVWYKDEVRYAEVVSTGLPSLDLALGVGGLPKKRIIELYGPEASGKTSLCLHMIGQVQKMGGNVVYIDVENSLDPTWAKKLGVNYEEMAIVQGEEAGQALDIARMFIKAGVTDLLVVDSVAALVTKAELSGDISDAHVAVQARLMGQTMKIINVDLAKTQTLTIWTNQVRMKIGNVFGNPEDTPGGKALKHAASVRIDVRKASDEDAYKKKQHAARVRIAKNKLAPPFGVGTFRIDPTSGIRDVYSIIDPAIQLGIISHKKGSSKYEYGDKSWNGQTRLITAMEKDPDLKNKIKEDFYNKLDEQLRVSRSEDLNDESIEEEATPVSEDLEFESEE